MIGLMFS